MITTLLSFETVSQIDDQQLPILFSVGYKSRFFLLSKRFSSLKEIPSTLEKTHLLTCCTGEAFVKQAILIHLARCSAGSLFTAYRPRAFCTIGSKGQEFFVKPGVKTAVLFLSLNDYCKSRSRWNAVLDPNKQHLFIYTLNANQCKCQ